MSRPVPERTGGRTGHRRSPRAATSTVTITATAPGPDGTRIGLGEVTGTVRPARTDWSTP